MAINVMIGQMPEMIEEKIAILKVIEVTNGSRMLIIHQTNHQNKLPKDITINGINNTGMEEKIEVGQGILVVLRLKSPNGCQNL